MGNGSTSPFWSRKSKVHISCSLKITEQTVPGKPNICRYFIIELRTLTLYCCTTQIEVRVMWVIDHCIFSHWIIIIDSLLLSLLSNSVMNLIHCANTAFTRPQMSCVLTGPAWGTCWLAVTKGTGLRQNCLQGPPLRTRLHQMCLHISGICRNLSYTGSHTGCVNKKILPWHHRTRKIVNINH